MTRTHVTHAHCSTLSDPPAPGANAELRRVTRQRLTIAPGVLTPKMPPTFDGLSSFFEYEDLIDDWLGINSLIGAASFYKNMLDNEQLRDLCGG